VDWSVRSDPHPRPGRGESGFVTVYGMGNKGSVDAEMTDTVQLGAEHFKDYRAVVVHPLSWAYGTDGVPLVQALVNGELRWLERAQLLDSAYWPTTRAVDQYSGVLATELDGYWSKKKEELRRRGTVTLRYPIVGAEGTELPAGDYKFTFVDTPNERDASGAPFRIKVRYKSQELLVEASVVLGEDTEALEKAKDSGHAPRLTAAAVFEVLSTVPSVWNYVVGPRTSADLKLRYVTAQVLGVVNVLRRLPETDVAEVADTVAKNPKTLQRFVEGTQLQGLTIGDTAYVRDDALGVGNEYHEALHRFSKPAVQMLFGFHFNEGVTEYFTRIVTESLQEKVVRDTETYGAQLRGVKALLDQNVINHDLLANAYFGGQVGVLCDHFDEAVKGRLSLQAYADKIGGTHVDAMITVLEAVLGDGAARKMLSDAKVDLSSLKPPSPPPAESSDDDLDAGATQLDALAKELKEFEDNA